MWGPRGGVRERDGVPEKVYIESNSLASRMILSLPSCSVCITYGNRLWMMQYLCLIYTHHISHCYLSLVTYYSNVRVVKMSAFCLRLTTLHIHTWGGSGCGQVGFKLRAFFSWYLFPFTALILEVIIYFT